MSGDPAAEAPVASVVIVVMMVVVMVMMVVVVIMMMVVMVVVIMVMVMVMVMVILSHFHQLFFSGVAAALVLSLQDLLGIRNGVQQLCKRAGRLQQAEFLDCGRGGGLRAAKEGQC